MNLIHDSWLPVRRRSGHIAFIAPWQITDPESDPAVMPAAMRPDFNGAIVQFLIGLLQTCWAPSTPREWRQRRDNPPKPETLRNVFESVAQAFEFEGDGPRFMQDFELRPQDGDTLSVSGLLIDQPGENALKNNTDHFIKRGSVERLCVGCAALAVLALQINAPSGGQGHRTGLRGGGPLSTLVVGDTLWQTCWLNVLERADFLSKRGNLVKTALGDRFPWMDPCRSSADKSETTPDDVHADQVFWAMPRRVRLAEAQHISPEAPCDICGTLQRSLYTHYVTRNYGVNYKGAWVHPLSPYTFDKDGAPLAVHPQPGGFGYRHWTGLVQKWQDNKVLRRPAAVVEQFAKREERDMLLWAFGYDMDNMKARCWYDATMPLIIAPAAIRDEYEARVENAVQGSHAVVRALRDAVKKAWFEVRPDGKRLDLSFVDGRFWHETEAEFYALVPNLRATLMAGGDTVEVIEGWHRTTTGSARRIFNDLSQLDSLEAVDARRVARAWIELNNQLNGTKTRGIFGLPERAPQTTHN